MYAFVLFCLNNYLNNLFGFHSPYEIINWIFYYYYEPNLIRCGEKYLVILKKNIHIWGAQPDYIVPEFERKDIVEIESGLEHIAVLTANSDLYTWGKNSHGQLGLGDSVDMTKPRKILSGVKTVACGVYFTICQTFEGNIYWWGLIMYGSFAYDCSVVGAIPKKLEMRIGGLNKIICGGLNIMFLTMDRFVFVVEYNLFDQSDTIFPTKLSLPDVITGASGHSHSVVLSKNYQVFVWGVNSFGQLGLGDNLDREEPHKLLIDNIIAVSCGIFQRPG